MQLLQVNPVRLGSMNDFQESDDVKIYEFLLADITYDGSCRY